MSDNEVIENIDRWHENSKLKVYACLQYLKQNNWSINKSNFLSYCKKALLINKPELFLLSLIKKPYIREWTNIEDQKRKAKDYGDVLKIENDLIILNPKYEQKIKASWDGGKKQ